MKFVIASFWLSPARFGLGMGSKVALGVTLVFLVVFFNVYQGVKEVSPLALSSAPSLVFISLHSSIGLAVVGAVVGEYLGSGRGAGYLVLQAEGNFDINTVMAGVLVLTAFALALALALALDEMVGAIEKRLMVWQPKAGETERL